MGHVLNNTIQDILSRKARMDGKEVLWLPGTDHAGIATQVQVEKALKKEEHKPSTTSAARNSSSASGPGRKSTATSSSASSKNSAAPAIGPANGSPWTPNIRAACKRSSWNSTRKGLIYRGKRMVNWCPVSQTALSDEEVEMKPQKGFMYHFKVQVVEEPGTWLTIATTRPETIPADTAVAVNPKDPRYAHLIGKHIYRALPLEQPRNSAHPHRGR
jgi:valyl-tRNA synthetase